MVICERCFCDTEVISVIRNKAEIGDCPLCKCKNVHISGYILRVLISLLSVLSFELEVKSPWAYFGLEKLLK